MSITQLMKRLDEVEAVRAKQAARMLEMNPGRATGTHQLNDGGR
jgi:hypothetical protein